MRPRSFSQRVRNTGLTTLFALLIAACGGGGGGGGDSEPPSLLPPATGPGDTQAFAPMAPGDTWFFDASGDPGTAGEITDLVTLAVTGTKSVLGQVAAVFSESVFSSPAGMPMPELYYTKGPGGVAFYGNNDPEDVATALTVPYAELLFPVQPGPIVAFVKSGLDYGDDLDGDSVNERFDVTYSSRLEGFESITVPAGTFAGSARRATSVAVTVRLSYSGQSVTVDATDLTWLAPGVGLVRQVTTLQAPDLGLASESSIEARGYSVSGVKRGFTVPLPLLENLGALTQTNGGEFPHWSNTPAVASDATRFLVLGKRYDPFASRFLLTRVGAIVSADGAIERSFDVGPPVESNDSRDFATAAFGGGTYLAVFEQRNIPAGATYGPTDPSIVAHRIAPDGTVTDPAPIVLVPPSRFLGSGPGMDSRLPALAYGGGRFLVVNYGGAHPETYLEGRFVSPAGTVTTAFRISPDHFVLAAPRIVFDGSQFLVAYSDTGGVRLIRVSANGVVLDPVGLLIPGVGSGAQLAAGSANRLIAWIGSNGVRALRVAPDGTPLDVAPIAVTSGDTLEKEGLTVGYSNGEYLLAWTRRLAPMSNGLAVYMARLGPDGIVRSRGTLGMLASAPAPMLSYGYTGGYVLPAIGVATDSSLLAMLEGTANGFVPSERIAKMHGVLVRRFAP